MALSTLCGAVLGCAGGPSAEATGATATQVSTVDVGALALANVGATACGTNSLGGTGFGSSCTGNGGQPEYWCADFVGWVWANAGLDTSGLTAGAGSFYVYGQNNGTLSNTPAVGDAVVYNYQGGGYADHVAIVTRVYGNGTIETLSGDWNGQSGSEAYFSSTSSAILNDPPYDSTVGSWPSVMGMTISGFIAPVGLGGGGYTPSGPCAGLDDGAYCGGDAVSGDSSTLYQCSGGQLAGSQPCANGCQVNPGGQDDACIAAAPASGPCAGLYDGAYCGGDALAGDPSTLYQCSGGQLAGSQACSNGCQTNPGGQDDICGCSGLYDGFYCGGDGVGGDSSTLYQCSGGTLSVSSVCGNGCSVQPAETDDFCN